MDRIGEIIRAHWILSDYIRRKQYDETGTFAKPVEVSRGDFSTRLKEFERYYKGSDEEKRHVLASYEKREGDMELLYQEVELSERSMDDERFRAIIDQAILTGKVTSYPAYEKKRKGKSGDKAEKKLKKAKI